MIIWLENLNYFMSSPYRCHWHERIPTLGDYRRQLDTLSFFAPLVNKFIDNNLINGNIEYEQAIKHFYNYCMMIADLSYLDVKNVNNDALYLIKTFKRIKGLFK